MPHRKAYRWFTNHLESAQLVMIGLGYAGTSVTWLGEPTASRAAGLAWLPFVNEQVFGFMWLITGIVAITVGLSRGVSRRLGHAALFFVPFCLSFVFSTSWLIWLLPDDFYDGGSETGYISSISFTVWAMYALFSALVWSKYSPVINAATRIFDQVAEEED